jgi:hypothetical protein
MDTRGYHTGTYREAIGVAAWVTSCSDIVERFLVRINEWVQKTERALSRSKELSIQHRNSACKDGCRA